LVTNGGFDTDSNWTKGANASISGGVATVNVVGGAFTYITQPVSYTVGAWYVVSLTLNGNAGNIVRILDKGGNTGALTSPANDITLTGSPQQVEYIFQANANSDEIQIARSGSGDWSFTVDNISVKELPGYTAVAASDAARPTLLSVLDTNASELTDTGTRGDELITDPSFDDPSAWTISLNGWTVADGKATGNGINSASVYLTNTFIELGATYEITFVVSDYTSGNLRPIVGDYSDIIGITGPGTYTATVQMTNGTALGLRSSVFIGSVSSISVRKVNTAFDERGALIPITNDPATGNNGDGTWTLNTGESARFTVDLSNLEDGAVYEVEVDVSALTGNGASDFCDNNTTALFVGTVRYVGTRATYDGTYRFIDVSAGGGSSSTTFSTPRLRKVETPNLLLLTSAGDDDFKFDTDTGNWVKAGGSPPTISGGVLDFSANTSGASLAYITVGAANNRWHKYMFYANTTGRLYLKINGNDWYIHTVTLGWNSVYFLSGSSDAFVQIRANQVNDYTGTIDNVIVQEVPESVARQFYLDFDGTDDNMILDGTDFGSSTNATLYKTFRGDTTDTKQIMFGTIPGPYILAAGGGEGSTVLSGTVGSPVYREDGTIPSYAIRGDIFTALVDDTDHTIGVEEVDLSASGAWTSTGFYIGGEYSTTYDNTGRLYAWAAVDTRLDGRNRDLLENFMLSKKTT
jgi:hypothetical protein